MSKDEIINRLTTLLNSEVISDNIKVDNIIFKETIELINKLDNDLKLKNGVIVKLAVKGLIKDE